MAAMSRRLEIRVDDEFLARVDEWRRNADGLPPQAEAVRTLVELGLARSKSGAIRFTDGEKVIITMMRDVYRALRIDGDINPDIMTGAMRGGHYWAVKWSMPDLFHDRQDDPRDVSFVREVLDTWSILERAYGKCSKKEKDRIAHEAAPFGKSLKFPGFDGTIETSYMEIAQCFVNTLGMYEQFKGRGCKSHRPMVPAYRRILNGFMPNGQNLNADEVISILKSMNGALSESED